MSSWSWSEWERSLLRPFYLEFYSLSAWRVNVRQSVLIHINLYPWGWFLSFQRGWRWTCIYFIILNFMYPLFSCLLTAFSSYFDGGFLTQLSPAKLHLPSISIWGFLARVKRYFKHNFFIVVGKGLVPLGFLIQPRKASFITISKLTLTSSWCSRGAMDTQMAPYYHVTWKLSSSWQRTTRHWLLLSIDVDIVATSQLAFLSKTRLARWYTVHIIFNRLGDNPLARVVIQIIGETI